MYDAGEINTQSLYGIAYCALLKASGIKTEVTRVLGLNFKTEWFLGAEHNIENVFWLIKNVKSVEAWCPEEDSNLHTLRHTDLNRARLPIPPSGQ